MNKKQKQELRQRQTARQLMGISQLTGYGVRTAEGELAFFLIKPDNLSVLSEEGVRGRVTALTHLLCAMPELRILALDSRESFQRNQEWYRQRLEQEELPALRELLRQDSAHLDEIQTTTASAREFVLVFRLDQQSGESDEVQLRQMEKRIRDQGFHASWVPREEHCVAVSGMISRLLGVYELAMVERPAKHLDLDRFCNEIWDHLHVSFVAPRMERQSERWGPRDRPETGRGALYKRAADLVATYEELLLVPDEACVTHYLGDLGIHIFKYDAAQEQIQNAYEKALSVMEMDDAEFQAEKQFVYRGEIISAMRDRLLVGELKPGETVLFVGTEPYGGPGDFELRGGVVEAVDPSERTCSVRGEFFTMHDVPLHYVLGRYDTSVEGEHYGFPHVRPLFGENRDLAGQYLREAEASWNVQQAETQIDAPQMM